MDRFYVISNSAKDPEGKIAHKIKAYLEAKGRRCLLQECSGKESPRSYKYTNASLIPEDTECILVVGGDGTLLQAARDLIERNIPLLGVNKGTLGYLAEVDGEDMETALDRLIEGNVAVEDRMMLEGCACSHQKKLLQDFALNDIVIARSGRLQIIDFNIYVNGEFLRSYSADGIIISTPTGSTGYSLSAGGPIVSPEAELLLLTPIAPHTLNTRSIVLPADAEITVELMHGHAAGWEEAAASFDGDTCVKLGIGDRIRIYRSTRMTRLIKINNISFLEVLRKKMNDQ